MTRKGQLEVASAEGWSWDVALTDRTDQVVAEAPDIAISSDSWILDHARAWYDIAGALVAGALPDAWKLAMD